MLVVLDTNVFLNALHSDGDSPDPGDDYLLAMAVTAGADYLVTGDKALLRLKRIARTPIVPLRRFAALLTR